MTPCRSLLCAFAAIALAGCAAAEAGTDPLDVPPTVGVGELPAPVDPPDSTVAADPGTTAAASSTTAPWGARGNRVLMIGDSILASTASRHGGAMCTALVPRGWSVAVEAEVSRQISFGPIVQRERLAEGWDVGVVFLGTNHTNDEIAYAATLDRVVADFGDVPVVLVNVTERNAAMAEVNAAIAAVAARHPRTVVIDWRAMTFADGGLLHDDRIHPTDRGKAALADAIAGALGDAPESPGRCLPSEFTDDGAGLPSDGSGPTPTTTTPRRPTTTSTTTKPTTAPSTAPTTNSPTTNSPTTNAPAATPTTTSPGATTTTSRPDPGPPASDGSSSP